MEKLIYKNKKLFCEYTFVKVYELFIQELLFQHLLNH